MAVNAFNAVMNGLAPIIAFHEVIHEVIVVEVAVAEEEQQVFQTPVAAAAAAAAANNHYNNNNIFAPTPNPRSPPALLHKQRASEDDSSVPAFSRAYTTKPSACRAIVF